MSLLPRRPPIWCAAGEDLELPLWPPQLPAAETTAVWCLSVVLGIEPLTLCTLTRSLPTELLPHPQMSFVEHGQRWLWDRIQLGEIRQEGRTTTSFKSSLLGASYATHGESAAQTLEKVIFLNHFLMGITNIFLFLFWLLKVSVNEKLQILYSVLFVTTQSLCHKHGPFLEQH